MVDVRYFEPLKVEDKRTYGASPTAYRAAFPPALEQAPIPACVVSTYGRPQHRTFREDSAADRG
jgi:hypothetical protein